MPSTASPTRSALDVLRSPTTGSERSIAIRVESVRYLATDAHAATIAPVLIKPTTVEAFARMTEDERLAVLVERFTVHRRAERRSRDAGGVMSSDRIQRVIVARRLAISAAPEEAPDAGADTTQEKAARVSRWSVSCADGCGAMVSAPGPKPVLRYLDASHRRRPASRPAA